jgi:hypothetical protein
MRTTEPSDLLELANVGPAVARHLGRAGVTSTSQLVGRDPVELFEEVCEVDGRRHDPCLLDTVMSAVDQANGGTARPWWHYTAARKRNLFDRKGTDRAGP